MRLQHRYSFGFKRLAPVEVDPSRSRQHELHGKRAFGSILGLEPFRQVPTDWLILADSGDHEREHHLVSWSNVRRGKPHRSPEWHLYYYGDTEAQPGDVLVLAKRNGEDLAVFVAPQGTSWESQLLSILGFSSESEFDARLDVDEIDDVHAVAFNEILAAVGWPEDLEPFADQSLLEWAINEFGIEFPKTAQFSAFVQNAVGDDFSSPDDMLHAWWLTEERLFREMENLIVAERLGQPFADVDEFVKFSLSVQNRRKSRAGHALENHLAKLFTLRGVLFVRGMRTENKNKPDFIFPGADEYLNPDFSSERLTMLAAKTTCKERWRQVLAEAQRIPHKHLCTLESSLSHSQLDQMAAESLTIVAPQPVIETYDTTAGASLMPLSEFIHMVLARQGRSN